MSALELSRARVGLWLRLGLALGLRAVARVGVRAGTNTELHKNHTRFFSFHEGGFWRGIFHEVGIFHY